MALLVYNEERRPSISTPEELARVIMRPPSSVEADNPSVPTLSTKGAILFGVMNLVNGYYGLHEGMASPESRKVVYTRG